MTKKSLNDAVAKSQQSAVTASRAVGRVAMESAQAIASINQKAATEFAELMQSRLSELMKTQNPQAAFEYVHAKVLQDAAKEVTQYHQELLGILRTGNQELAYIAQEMIEDSKADLIHFVNDATDNAPIGSEAYVSIFKTSFSNALQNFELVRAAMADSFANFEKSVESVSNLSQISKPAKKSKSKE